MKMVTKDGKLYAEVTLRDVVMRSDVSDTPMLAEIKRLYEENDKLREYAEGMGHCLGRRGDDDCHSCPLWDPETCLAYEYERELGLEE